MADPRRADVDVAAMDVVDAAATDGAVVAVAATATEPTYVDGLDVPADADGLDLLAESGDPADDGHPVERRSRVAVFRTRTDRIATWLLVAAAACVALGGVTLALGFPRPHTLLVYASIAFGGLGVLLALPKALSGVPFDPSSPTPRRRSDD